MVNEAAETTLPIAEHFVAPQGEGQFTGTLMQFIRTAGCCVGKPWTATTLAEIGKSQTLFNIPAHNECCTLYDGRHFVCDTDYTVSGYMTIPSLIDMIKNAGVKHVCITGGEPLLHAAKLTELVIAANGNVKFHLETSGTVSLAKDSVQLFISELISMGHFIATSPKLGYIDEEYSEIVHEAKILVDKNFDIDTIPPILRARGEAELVDVYLQPVNNIHSISDANLNLCLALQQRHPWLRLSIQAHKAWGTR